MLGLLIHVDHSKISFVKKKYFSITNKTVIYGQKYK